MNLTKLKAQLVLHEGSRKFPYVDSVGKTTIGIGRNLTDKGISQTTIDQMAIEDITDTINFLTSQFPWFIKLDDVRQRALADLTFDLMHEILDFKKMLGAIETQDWATASSELLNSTFAKQTGKRAIDLAYMLLHGQDPH